MRLRGGDVSPVPLDKNSVSKPLPHGNQSKPSDNSLVRLGFTVDSEHDEIRFGESVLDIPRGNQFRVMEKLVSEIGVLVSYLDLHRALAPKTTEKSIKHMHKASGPVWEAVKKCRKAIEKASVPFEIQNERQKGFKLCRTKTKAHPK